MITVLMLKKEIMLDILHLVGHLKKQTAFVSLFKRSFVSNIFFQQYFSYIMAVGQFYCRRKPEYPEKTTVLSQVIDKLYNITT
jgi:hypothetical protein